MEEGLASATEESPANAEEEISAIDNDTSSVMCTQRRSQQEKRKPDRYGFSYNLTTIEEPVSVKGAVMQEWIGAMNSEMNSLHDNDVCDLVELPKGQKVVGSQWVFKLNRNEDEDVRLGLWLMGILRRRVSIMMRHLALL